MHTGSLLLEAPAIKLGLQWHKMKARKAILNRKRVVLHTNIQQTARYLKRPEILISNSKLKIELAVRSYPVGCTWDLHIWQPASASYGAQGQSKQTHDPQWAMAKDPEASAVAADAPSQHGSPKTSPQLPQSSPPRISSTPNRSVQATLLCPPRPWWIDPSSFLCFGRESCEYIYSPASTQVSCNHSSLCYSCVTRFLSESLGVRRWNVCVWDVT